MQSFKNLSDLKIAYPESGYSVFRVVGGLGSQLFSLSEAYLLHVHTSKRIVLEYSSCEFLDSTGSAHSTVIAEKLNWAILVILEDLEEIYSERYMIQPNFPHKHSYVNEGFIADYNRVKSIGLFKPGKSPLTEEDLENSNQFGAIHFRYSPLYKGNLGNINEFYLRSVLRILVNKTEINEILVFSNNKEHAMQTLEKLVNDSSFKLKFASHENPLSEILQMSEASFLIGSNSAMSWWGSYFGNQISFFPKPFYLGYWGWEKEFFGPNMVQVNQFKFMQFNRAKNRFLRHWRARGLTKLKIKSFVGFNS
jgi:hypothetical protein